MNIQTITPEQARGLLACGAVLIDIREADEHARERIAQARHVPLSGISDAPALLAGAQAVIFHCRSGNRTRTNAEKLASCTPSDVYLLEGGLDAWKGAGLPVVSDRTRPIELQRQVQIAAGSIVLLAVVLGATLSPLFYGIAGLVGAGLTFAGLTGTCGMARLLQLMPWNRRLA
jgi:rhodanese-related sulfurtransferase